MAIAKGTRKGKRRGFLVRLGRDQAGNVFAMTAAAVVPMIGVVGGAIDASRMYMVRSRLQAACDSGVLAARKAMSNNTLSDTARNRGSAMFNFNFQQADFQTSGTSFVPTADANGRVNATASTNIPMTLMKVFGFGTKSASVSCSADVQIPNIDIVFVLDVTGSMDDEINGTRKIVSLKAAAKRFYTTLKTQMDANGANAGRVRYGFVPYSQTVNGKNLFKTSANASLGELPMTHLVDQAVVESRVAHFAPTGGSNSWIDDPATNPSVFLQRYDKDQAASINPMVASNTTGTVMSNNDCANYGQNKSFSIDDSTNRRVYLYPYTSWPGDAGIGYSTLYQAEGQTTLQTTKPSAGNYYWQITFERESGTWEDKQGEKTDKYNKCVREVTWNKYIRTVPEYKFSHWSYQSVTYDVSAFKSGSAVTFVNPRYYDSYEGRWYNNDNRDFNDYTAPGVGPYTPVELAATPQASRLNHNTMVWNGCLEERNTQAVSDFTPIPAGALDLNWVLGGTSTETRWRPIMDKLTYNRGTSAAVTSTSTISAANHSCPTVSMQNLNVLTQSAFNTYVDSLQPLGYTYLDIGMIWGLRMIAPQGLFAARNLVGDNGGQISRHIIFLTDGEPVSADNSVTSYGLETVSKRITGSTGVSAATLHSRRFQALCDAQRGTVAIWAIAFGTSVTGNLSNCADTGRAYQADDATDLDAAFTSIARDIADLRLVS